MSELKLTLTPSGQRAVAGGSIPLRLEMVNTSAQELQIAKPAGIHPPPLVFELRREAEAVPAYELSREALNRWVAGSDVLPSRQPNRVPLKAGEAVSVEEDLAVLAVGGLAPGKYQVVARWEQDGLEAVSNAVGLEVVVPQVRGCASLMCSVSGQSVVLLSQSVPGGTVLAERSIDGIRLEGATTVERHRIAAPAEVSDLLLAAHLEEGIQGRWHGWIQNQELWAACSWGEAVVAKPPPIRIPLEAPRFAGPAFHLGRVRTACGVLVGLDGAGRAVGQRWGATPQRLTLGPSFALSAVRPLAVGARGISSTGRILLVWAERAGQETQVSGVILDEHGKLQGAPQVLYRSARAWLAWEIPPVGKLLETEILLLLGPGEDRDLRLVRVPWQGEPREDRVFGPKETVDSWLVSGVAPGGPTLAAITSRQIWVQRGGSEPWRPLMGGQMSSQPSDGIPCDPPEFVHLLAHKSGERVGWFEAGQGLRYASPAG